MRPEFSKLSIDMMRKYLQEKLKLKIIHKDWPTCRKK